MHNVSVSSFLSTRTEANLTASKNALVPGASTANVSAIKSSASSNKIKAGPTPSKPQQAAPPPAGGSKKPPNTEKPKKKGLFGGFFSRKKSKANDKPKPMAKAKSQANVTKAGVGKTPALARPAGGDVIDDQEEKNEVELHSSFIHNPTSMDPSVPIGGYPIKGL